MSQPRNLLFVCIENSNRSQMAEAFARLHGGERVQAFSAGSQPSGKISPKALEARSKRKMRAGDEIVPDFRNPVYFSWTFGRNCSHSEVRSVAA